MSKVLIVSAHPDDETLGCGGTILKHKENGDTVYWMIATNVNVKDGWKKKVVAKRQQEIDKISEFYGFSKTFKLDFPAAKLDTIPLNVLITAISAICNIIKPEIMYLPNKTDVHTDHQIIFQAAFSCTKSFRYSFIRRVLMYECLSETEFAPALRSSAFVPNAFVDITSYLGKKIEAMRIYDSEIMDDPFPRSIEVIKSMAKVRGSRIGKRYAEAFNILLDIA